MCTKFDDFSNNRKLEPEEENRLNVIILSVFIFSAVIMFIGVISKLESLSILGGMGLFLSSFYVIPLIIDMLRKNKKDKKSNLQSQMNTNSTNQTLSNKNVDDNFDVIKCIKNNFIDELDIDSSTSNIIVLNKQSKYLYSICIKIDCRKNTMQLYCPFFYPKSFGETDIAYGVYLKNLFEFLNKLNLKYIAYKFFVDGLKDKVGFVSIDYPLINNESVVNFLKNEINNMMKLLDEVFPQLPKDCL